MYDPDSYIRTKTQIEVGLKESQRHRVIVFSLLIVSLAGVAGTFWFDQPKVSLILGCIAFYLSVEAICGEIGRLGQTNALLETLQTKEVLEFLASARKP